MPRTRRSILGLSLLAAASPRVRGAEDAYSAEIKTSMGTITIELFRSVVPYTTQNFMDLALGKKEWVDPRTKKRTRAKLYDGTSFHRIIRGQFIQGGDPAGTGFGNPGFSIRDEIVPTLKFDRAGRVAMANSGPNTNGCQFFITTDSIPSLNGQYTIFGQVRGGMDVVEKIERVPKIGERPRDPVRILSVSISAGVKAH
ncbi:MAG: peptidylprolyl isomerase [Bryobacteraceae bacterium]